MHRTPRIQALGRLAAALAILVGLLLPLGGGTAAALGVGASACSRPLDAAASFESVNYPDHFIRHSHSLGVLTRATDGLGAMDATFIVRPGLSGTPGSVSFESVNVQGQFLRHEHYRIRLSPRQETDLFRQDASFVVSGEGCEVRFESVNLPGHFIRHQNYELWLANNMAGAREMFAQDTTWGWQAPTHTLALGVGRSQQRGDSRDFGVCSSGGPVGPPPVDFVVGWQQVEYLDGPCHAGVGEAAVLFDAGPLHQVPNKTIDRAVLTFDEAEDPMCAPTPCWSNGEGQQQHKPDGCVVVRLPTWDWPNAAPPPGLLPYSTSPVPAVRRLGAREWDVTEPFKWQQDPEAISITPGPRSVPGFGFLLTSGPSLDSLEARDSTSCRSLISNVRLQVTVTVWNDEPRRQPR